ncbi:MAG: DUF2207 family protein, partial [Candidatus Caldipriscus sp.]
MIWLIIVEPYIKSFESFIDVRMDGVMVVKERIVVDFGEEERHGIYRRIPYYFQGRKLEFNLISVEDDSGRSYQVLEKKEGGEVYWRIGDPEVLVKGENVYNITYEVKGAINYFKEHDEIYWNVNGTEWEMRINEVSCVVNLPEGVDVSKVKYTFYTVKKGSREQNGKAWVEGNKVFFKAGPFKAGENLIIAISLPRGILIDQTDKYLTTSVEVPKSASIEPSESSWISRNWGLLFMILLPLISLLYMLSQYFRYGRDPRINRSIMVEYEPPENLKPAEIGTLVDEYADDRDIVATIIDLAIRGYLKIRPLGDKDVEIEVLREGDDLEGYERKVFEAIKESAEDGKVLRLGESLEPSKAKKLHDTLESVKDEVYDLLTKIGYFQEKPDVVREKYALLGVIMSFIGFLIALITALVLQNLYIGIANLFIMFIMALAIFPIFLTSFRKKKKFYTIAVLFIALLHFPLFTAFMLLVFPQIMKIIFELLNIVSELFESFRIFIFIIFIMFIMIFKLLNIVFELFEIMITIITFIFIFFFIFFFMAIIFVTIPTRLSTLFISDKTKKFYGYLYYYIALCIDILVVYMYMTYVEIIYFLHHPSIEVPLGFLLAGAIISFIGLHMPRKTERGVEMYKRVLGFKEFVKRVEEDYLKLMDPTKLERIIPYAIVLGIENIWIEKIGNVLNYKPSWIETLTEDTGIDIRNLFKWW